MTPSPISPDLVFHPCVVAPQVLDELLRSEEDEDDAITQKMFAQTPDDKIRRSVMTSRWD
jgi:hypothetical protein